MTVSIVMPYMIAFGFEDIGILVFDLPAGSSRLDKNLNGCSVNKMLRRKCIAIQDGPIGFFGDGEFTPIDPQRVFTLAPGNIVGIPIGVNLMKATIPASDGTVLEISRSF